MKKTIILMLGMVAGASAIAADFDAEAVYNQSCSVCHAAGVAGAPKKGDKAAWDAKIETLGGKEQMIQKGIAGNGAMPPKGTAAITDEEFAQVTEFMLQ